MPNEPDNNIEEQLKAWAAARRSDTGEPFELHPATRRMLQDEVARTYPATRRESKSAPGWLALLRPRLALALSAVAATVVLSVALWPSLAPNQVRGRQLLADRGEKKSQEPWQETLVKAEGQAAAEPAPAGRAGNEVTPPPAAMPALAVNNPAQSPAKAVPMSRAHRFGEATQTLDARSGVAKNSAESLERTDALATGKPVLEEKRKEIALARDVAALSDRDASATPGRRESTVEQYGVKPTNSRGLDDAPTAAGRKTDETTLAVRLGAVASEQTLDKRPVTAGAPAVAGTGNEKDALLSYRKLQAPSPPGAPAAVLEADRAQVSNELGFFDLASGQATQQFAQVARYRRNFNSPPMPAILSSFQLEQRGRRLRIVDADGSIYEGEFIAEAVSTSSPPLANARSGDELKETEARKQDTLTDGAAKVGQNANFRVAGTNRTLNQPVVFTGNLWVPAPVPAAAADTPQRGAALLQQPPASRTPPNLPRVQGQATIGSDRLEINAITTGP